MLKVLILGGYGVFGGRLAELLADASDLELLIGGRSLSRAQAFCSRYRGQARAIPVHVDRDDIARALAEHRPDLLVDASGPFQDYGADRYRVIEACIAARVDYLDFADAADFVSGVGRLDDRARAAGVFVLSGVSSFPVLTAAVLREMAGTMTIVSVTGGIAPSPYAGIGLNVMRAVVGYAGAPVRLIRGGRAAFGIGLAESLRFTIAPPGRLPLRNLRFSLVDVPDLQVLPPEHPTMTDIWMGAGPVPESLHRILNLLAVARARFRLPSLAPFSRLFYAVLNLMKFGEHRGGMFVQARGLADGKPVQQTWHLLAEGDDGPYIPSMAIEALVRGLLAGRRPAPGARSAVRALDLADYDALFEGRNIFTGFRSEEPEASLYRRVLGTAFDALPAQVRRLHDATTTRSWAGHAEVRRGRGLLAKILAALLGFPDAASRVPVRVTFAVEDGREIWTRDFGGRTFSSVQSAGVGRNQHLLVESFGPLAFALALVLENDRLILIPRRWSFLGVPMPRAFLPSANSYEAESDGRFSFNVEIASPLTGLIVAYQGALEPIAFP